VLEKVLGFALLWCEAPKKFLEFILLQRKAAGKFLGLILLQRGEPVKILRKKDGFYPPPHTFLKHFQDKFLPPPPKWGVILLALVIVL